MSSRPLPKKFFNRPTLQVARDLLGKFLIRNIGGEKIIGRITEVEAYDGLKDRASHARRGMTKRNRPMFGPAGCWYIYLNYGIHWLVNVTIGPVGYPAAILIRGVEEINGPGRVGSFFRVSGKLSGKPAVPETGFWIEDRGVKIRKSLIKRSPRVGVDYAGPIWSKKRYRFLILK